MSTYGVGITIYVFWQVKCVNIPREITSRLCSHFMHWVYEDCLQNRTTDAGYVLGWLLHAGGVW